MLAAKFDALFDLVSNWGRWGVDDQRGTLNHRASTGLESPIHALALTAMGMPLIDNMNLEDLATACEDLDRWEFLFSLATLRIPAAPDHR